MGTPALEVLGDLAKILLDTLSYTSYSEEVRLLIHRFVDYLKANNADQYIPVMPTKLAD